ncbi:signal peptidase I [Enteropsectra breve]|nr:signal peptidase I [Enteropsectra breve]
MLHYFLTPSEINTLKRLNLREFLKRILNAAYSLVPTYMLWKAVCLFLNNDSPIVSVLSESMEPGYRRGDILFLKPQEFKSGDIAVYQVYKDSIPIVHRVINKLGKQLLTKGDNNRVNDIGIYRPGRRFLEPREMRAGVFGYIPWFGYPSIWISSIPGLKYLLFAVGAYSMFFDKESSMSFF